jgi:hypothetical protein
MGVWGRQGFGRRHQDAGRTLGPFKACTQSTTMRWATELLELRRMGVRPTDNNMKHSILQDAALLKGRSGVTRSSLHNPTWKNRGGQGHVLARSDQIHRNLSAQKDKMNPRRKKFRPRKNADKPIRSMT